MAAELETDSSVTGDPSATWAAAARATGLEIRLLEYEPPAFLVDHVDLVFLLDPARTIVRSRLTLRRNPRARLQTGPLRLDGEGLRRGPVLLDEVALDADRISQSGSQLSIDGIGAAAVLDIETELAPQTNTELSGLYLSGGGFFTQCEAEGFRRIIFFPDRPDVMARFTTTLVADAARCPVLLSNGNQVDGGDCADGRHWAKWQDPHPKPSYLFALVAADLLCVRDAFVTRSGRQVALAIHVRRGHEDACGHAMQALKQSMAWDERVFGLEYDLDVFNIAAVADFNMGAMENKGLNIFNTKYVLARPETATDADYQGIETVIAHEYFHNWTGNRVTCRDWFQLSLKEGLTVFRDQEFSADQGSRAVKRIGDVRRLRAAQFPEDAGPLAHPVRPDHYVKIDNFYTATVYQKGAEIVRMIRTLIGPAKFRLGMDLYFARHDNSAVTIEDFIACMTDAASVDVAPFMPQFLLWYTQAGTPVVTASDRYDARTQRYTLTLRQHTEPTPGQPDKTALLIPVAMGLLDAHGAAMPTRLAGEPAAQAGTRVLRLDRAEQSFVFVDVAGPPTPSLLRDFSAPVRLTALTPERLRFLAAHDSDRFVQWDSLQQYATLVLLQGVALHAEGLTSRLDDGLSQAFAAILDLAMDDPAFAAEALGLPSEAFLADQMAVVDVVHIHAAREQLRADLGGALRVRWRALFDACDDDKPYRPDADQMGRRALKAVCLGYLGAAGEVAQIHAQYAAQRNMTDVLAALALLNNQAGPARAAALADFGARWRHDDLVMDKWFAIQAMSPLPDALAAVRTLTAHPAFDLRNPNRMRSLVASFAMANPLRFHAADGSGYQFLAEKILELDAINSQAAARMVPPLGAWRRHEPGRRAAMRAALQHLLDWPDLSAATREMAARSLV